jgi:hypothetical protein
MAYAPSDVRKVVGLVVQGEASPALVSGETQNTPAIAEINERRVCDSGPGFPRPGRSIQGGEIYHKMEWKGYPGGGKVGLR